MDTATRTPNQTFSESPSKRSTPTSRHSSKRKRDDTDKKASPLRNAPSRRSVHQIVPQHAEASENNAFLTSGQQDESAAQFDFEALQAHTAQPSGSQTNAASHSSNAKINLDTEAAAAALNQHYSMTVPPHPDENFINQPTSTGPYESTVEETDGFAALENASGATNANDSQATEAGASSSPVHDSDATPMTTPSGRTKLPVGSRQYDIQRKANHKEVERRRRETINEGINELAKIVPGCEKNKGSILGRAAQYIVKLQEEASSNIDKWTFEKLITEQAIAGLGDKLHNSWREKNLWRQKAKKAGVNVAEWEKDIKRMLEEDDESGKEDEEGDKEESSGDSATDDTPAVNPGVSAK